MQLTKVETVLAPYVLQVGHYESEAGEQIAIYFRTLEPIETPLSTDHFFIVGVIAAYLRGEPYAHLGPVSERLYNNMITAVHKWSAWWHYPVITITAATAAETTPSTQKPHRGCLMTGGVDSLFTARTEQDEIAAFVHVTHNPASAADLETDCSKISNLSLAGFAQEQGKQFFQIETNVMTAFSQIEDAWSSISHGPCYAAIGHFLGGNITDLLISASFSKDQMRPWGSHPETDSLFSSSLVKFRHVGVGFNRFQKHRDIASNRSYLKYLSVCENGPQDGTHINCSKCQKCLRSMITLDLLNIDRSDAPTFNWYEYRPENLKNFLLQGHVNTTEMLAYADEIGREDVAVILRDVIKYAEKYNWIIQLELWLRRRLNGWLKYKPLFKRLRAIAYRLFRIRQRHQTLPNRKRHNETLTSLELEHRRD